MMNGADLADLTSAMRSAGLNGDRHAFASAYQDAASLAERIRAVAPAAALAWFDLLRFDLETANGPAILVDIDHGERAAPNHRDLLARVRGFAGRNALLLAKTHRTVLDLAAGQQPEIPDDLCIGTWFRLLLLPESFSSSRDIWAFTCKAAIDVANRRQLSVYLLPDYLEQMIRRRRRHYLSFHTTGRSPGVVHFKPADFPRRVILDEGGYSGWSTLARTRIEDLVVPDTATVETFFQSHSEAVIRDNISKYAQRGLTSDLDLPDDFMFVALQVSTDRTQRLARVPMLDMLDMVLHRFDGTETQVVVKRHPVCTDPRVAERLAQLQRDRKIIISDASIHALIPKSRGVCTINSGVGSESIIYLKPIYLFGEADYNCVSHRISNYEDFMIATQDFRTAVSPLDMKKFLYVYRNEYQTDVDNESELRSKIEQRMFLNRSSDVFLGEGEHPE